MSKPAGSFSEFNSLIDKATDPTQLEPDNESVKQICFSIDKGVIEASYIIQLLLIKMTDENPNTVLFSLRVLEKIFYECGNLAHRVICTENFMSLLKVLIETSEQKLIRDKILELVQTWTITFKHLPQYSAPQKLLRSLQAEGYVFPGFESVKLPYDKKVTDDSTSKSVTNVVLKNKDYNNRDSKSDSDIYITNQNNDFMLNLREVKEKKKMEFKQHQKSLGLPTSSDEEDNDSVVSKMQPSEILYEMSIPKSGLTADLKRVKQSREAVNRGLKKYWKLKHDEFMQRNPDGKGGSDKVLQLTNPEEKCSTCEEYKKSCNHDIIFERSIPRLHSDLSKVKESKEILQNSWEEVKNKKKQDYYSTKSNDSSGRYQNKDSQKIDGEFQKPVEMSQTDCNSISLIKPRTRLAIREEQEDFDRAIQLSLLDKGPGASVEDDELQRAIDESFAEAEKQNFSAFPKLETNDPESVFLSYVTAWSLDDSYEKERKLTESYIENDVLEPCVICTEKTKFLKTFKPCNHRCICDDCSKMYKSQQCPICREYYASITF